MSSTQPTVQDRLGKLEAQVQTIIAVNALGDNTYTTVNYFPKNCNEIQNSGYNVSGINRIQPKLSTESFFVFCDMVTKGGGWAYFLKRFDGSQDFYRKWEDYKRGFSNLVGKFWLGLEHLYQLTGYEINELLVELVDWNDNTTYAHYSYFSIGCESEGYPLKILGGYNGNAGDSLIEQAGQKFSTKDKDQDSDIGHCASFHKGAWWYKGCMKSHLTGDYKTGGQKYKVMYWNSFHGPSYSLKEVRMMVKPQNSEVYTVSLHRQT